MGKFGKTCKEYMVNEMVKCLEDYPDFFLTTFSRIGVNDIEKLRKSQKKDTAVFMVVKNSLFKRAIERTKRGIDITEALPSASGPCGIFFSKDNAVSASRNIVNFGKDKENFKIQGAYIAGQAITAETVKRLASLPSREVLLAMAVGGIKAPVSSFVLLLGNLIRNLVGVVDAISHKKNETEK